MKKQEVVQWDSERAINGFLVMLRQLKWNAQAVYAHSRSNENVQGACLGLNALAEQFMENIDHLQDLSIIVAHQYSVYDLTDEAYGVIE